ncbi:helix-turn-helix domain-containing protein [Mucilaginibacter conchicola]|uniref:Helix-turn-helix domain-containing protein n=1 Tax=Mucilaginibacter conchicola TaxID=2303333 RepID=A0A372NQU2_9SPHI|nr:ABC transporter permease [Mucilaginibacter conchicola]RFZ91316.1 helix-turn-helix domain-containing protein [Mucilaginibacter conchicola]
MDNYIFHISLYHLALLAVIFTGIATTALLWYAAKSRGPQNRILALAMFSTVLSAAALFAALQNLYNCPLSPLPGLGPLLFFYVRKITKPNSKLRLKHLLHFVPLILIGIVPGPIGLAPVSILLYLYAIHQQITTHYDRIAFNSGDRHRKEWRWLQWPLLALGVLSILSLLFETAGYISGNSELNRKASYLFVPVSGILMIWLSCRAFFRTYDPPQAAIAYLKPRPQDGIREKGIWLKRSIKLNRYYLDPEISLQALAAKLEMHPNELSRIINTVLKKSFNDLINEYRVAEVCRKIQDPAFDRLTLLGVALESGFNAKTTFNRVFKEMTGKSPAAYKKEQEKERPNYNMGRPAAFPGLLSYQNTARHQAVTKQNRYLMLKNHFKIAWRNLLRNRSYTSINIAGLAIGIAACMLIFLVVQYETSFDNYHTDKDRIYRIVRVTSGPDGVHTGVGTPLPFTQGLKTDFPQLKQVSDIMQSDGSFYIYDETKTGQGAAVKKFKETLAYYTDPEFFHIFKFNWLAGNKKTALTAPNTIVLSKNEADKFFGDWHKAMGRTIRVENNTNMQVTGIFEDPPVNTDIPIKLAMSWTTLVGERGALKNNISDWVSTFGAKHCYIVLPEGLSESRLNKELAAFTKRHTPPPYEKRGTYRLQALKDIHYDPETSVYSGHTFSRQLIAVISLIGLFLLVIACVNFINLATAQAVNRSKEVGVRKVLGSNRRQLVFQFISETFMITLFAILSACMTCVITLPMLNGLLEIRLSALLLISPEVSLFLIAITCGVTLLAGLYPALVLSGFNPTTALRNKVNAGKASGISLRRVLVVTQFCIAQFLVIGTLILIYQMNYFKNKSLGFDKEAVINVPYPGDSTGKAKVNTLVNELNIQPGVNAVSLSTFGPSDDGDWYSDFKFDHSPNPTDFASCLKWADPEFFKLYRMEFVAGGAYPNTDTVTGYVINETLMHKLGITDPKQALGKNIILWNRKNMSAPVVGVVKDFNAGSLRNAIPPVLMGAWKDQYSKLNIKIGPHNVKQTLSGIERLWNKTYPEGIYEYRFLDQTIAGFYKKEQQLSTLYKIFAGIAIFISCLGLYGLVSFMAAQRTKEVGIRKTLGASAAHIVYLFSKEFTLLILVAFIISAPLGYFLMNKWLEDYVYRITIGPGIFLWAILASVAIAWASVGLKAVRAAMANPVKSLRSE